MASAGCLFDSFLNLFAQFKTMTKSHQNYVFLYPFSNMAISPQNNPGGGGGEEVFCTGKLYGLIGMLFPSNDQNKEIWNKDDC